MATVIICPMRSQLRSELDDLTRRLIDQAIEARTNAHAPYSGFAVGAAVRSADGRVYSGCNIEISSYGLTMCAERVALFAARAAGGAQKLEAIAVIGPQIENTAIWPCGACRQAIWDLAPDASIYTATPDGRVECRTCADLLPDPFGPAQLSVHRDSLAYNKTSDQDETGEDT